MWVTVFYMLLAASASRVCLDYLNLILVHILPWTSQFFMRLFVGDSIWHACVSINAVCHIFPVVYLRFDFCFKLPFIKMCLPLYVRIYLVGECRVSFFLHFTPYNMHLAAFHVCFARYSHVAVEAHIGSHSSARPVSELLLQCTQYFIDTIEAFIVLHWMSIFAARAINLWAFAICVCILRIKPTVKYSLSWWRAHMR